MSVGGGGVNKTERTRRNNEIIRRAAAGEAHVLLAAEFGLSRGQIHQILYPERYAARLAVTMARKRGQIQPASACQRCNAVTAVDAHHPDYSRPLHVEWLCSTCHGIEHREGRTPLRMIRIPHPMWKRVEEVARAVSDREGRTVSASELLRRLIEQTYPAQPNEEPR